MGQLGPVKMGQLEEGGAGPQGGGEGRLGITGAKSWDFKNFPKFWVFR